MDKVKLHGLALTIPTSWRDQTVYQFVSPLRVAVPVRAAVGRAAAPVHRNVIVRRLPLPPGITGATLSSLFDRTNEAQAAHDPSFRVGKQGRAVVQARPAAWQDATFVEPRGGATVFQRHVAILGDEDDVVLVVATSDTADLETVLGDFGVVLEHEA